MRKRGKAEYRALVMEDDGLTHGRVSCALLKAIGARPVDYMVFRLDGLGEVVLRISCPRMRLRKDGGRKAATAG